MLSIALAGFQVPLAHSEQLVAPLPFRLMVYLPAPQNLQMGWAGASV